MYIIHSRGSPSAAPEGRASGRTPHKAPAIMEGIIMEDINGITTAISMVGFPIVMCGALFWYMIQESKSHKEETSALKDAINKLELAITTLINKLEA